MIILVKFAIGMLCAVFISHGLRKTKDSRNDLIDYGWCIGPPSLYLFWNLVFNIDAVTLGALFTFGSAYLFYKVSFGAILKKKVRNFLKSFLEEDKDE